MAEEVYFSTTDVKVTSERVIFDSQAYYLDEVSVAKLGLRRPRKYVIALYSYMALIITYVLEIWATGLLRDILFYGKWVLLFGSALLLLLSMREMRYVVRITGTFGQAEPFMSGNKMYVQKAVNAINGAINKRKDRSGVQTT